MIPVRFGHFALIPGQPDEPDVYASVAPEHPFRWRWQITTGESGYALTEMSALRKACRAAERATVDSGGRL